MWRVAAGLLGFIAGCNWVFGLGETRETPDAPPPEAQLPTVQLTYQVATTDNLGQPDPALSFPPISPPPVVRVGPIDGDLVETTYVDGAVAIPQALYGSKYRLEYTLPNSVPIEVHWAPPPGKGNLVVPIFGRLERTPAPAGSGYRVTIAHNYNLGHIYTTGFWSDTDIGAMTTGMNDISMASVVALSGDPGSPEAARNDIVSIVDYQAITGGPGNMLTCTNSSGDATFIARTLMPGAFTSVTPNPVFMNVAGATPTYTYADGLPFNDVEVRLRDRLGNRSGAERSRTRFGRLPSLGMHSFTQSARDVIGARLVGPLMIPLSDCPMNLPDGTDTTTSLAFGDPPDLVEFPSAVHAYAENRRITLTGVPMTSGIAVVNTVDPNMADTYAVEMRVPLAVRPIDFDQSLSGDSDRVPVGGTGRIELSFDLENLPAATADYFVVVLHRVITTGTPRIEPIRVYVLADPSAFSLMLLKGKLTVDTSVLAANDEYVFSIHAHRGRPQAVMGDFAVNSFPQVMTTVFTRTFIKT